MTLPPPQENQNYVSISPFAAGHITLPEYIFYAPSDPTARVLVPSLSFLIQHRNASLSGCGKGKPFRMLFDLGVRAEPTRYVPVLQEHIKSRSPIHHRPSARDNLVSAGFKADDIDAIAISHVHWDHHGDPEDFPNSTFLLGPGAQKVLSDGLPGTGNHSVFDPNLYRDSNVVEFSPLPESANTCDDSHDGYSNAAASNNVSYTNNSHMEPNQTIHTNGHISGFADGADSVMHINEANSSSSSSSSSSSIHAHTQPWKPLGPFPHTLDLLGDNSIYIVSAPGHLPGHINLLCRTSPTKWVYLGGDTFHDRGMLTGEKWITTYPDESGDGRTCCIHVDRAAAQGSLERVGELVRGAEEGRAYEVETVVAHDVVWWGENGHRALPNRL